MAIYKGLNVRDDIEDHIFNETLRLFNEAASKGLTDSKWSDEVPDEFINQMSASVEEGDVQATGVVCHLDFRHI